MATKFGKMKKPPIKIYHSFEEQEKDEIAFLASLSVEERMKLFFELWNLSRKLQPKRENKGRKIEIREDVRFWE